MSQFDASLFNGSLFGGGVPPTCAIKCRDVLYIAFREARILLRPQALNSENELRDGLIFLNQQLNYWAARGCYAWTSTFNVYNLSPGHQPHLIGPSLPPPDFNMAERPTRILSANIILPGSAQPIDVPLNIRDNAWWAANQDKGCTSSIPTDLYYQPDIPNGQLWFWPVSTGANGLRLETEVYLQQFVTLNDCFIAPQAYLSAITLTLAEELVDIWGTPMPVNLARRAIKARDALQSNNNLAPRISTADWGTFSTPSGGFNYMTGTIPE